MKTLTATCSIKGCDRGVAARGWCMKHYQRWNTYGTTELRAITPQMRFWSKVDRRFSGACWVWEGVRDRDGYGAVKINQRTRRAHTVAWTWTHGDPAPGLVPDHLCRVRSCVNPDHIEWVTNEENILRGNGVAARNARKTHCKRGHEFTVENTRLVKRGRACKQCERERGY